MLAGQNICFSFGVVAVMY